MQLTDLAIKLVADNVCVLGVNLLLDQKADLPQGDDAFAVLASTPGTTPDWVHNHAGPKYRKPGVQVRVRARKTTDAFALAEAIYLSLTAINNQVVNGVWYRSVKPLQEPSGAMGPDDIGRAQVSFNLICDKRGG